MSGFERARDLYLEWGVNVESAITQALATPISIHCWQADDVGGFEVREGVSDSGGILATGNYPGKARNGDEARQDFDQVLSLVPGVHRLNLHAIYAETGGAKVERDNLTFEHFQRWRDWSEFSRIHLDFNPTYFAHPMAASGYTLSSADPAVRNFWVRHGTACQEIAASIGRAQGSPCVINHWIPDGAKDSPVDRWSPRARLVDSLDRIIRGSQPALRIDSVESKLFGLGSEDYVVGSFEFYASYALTRKVHLCLDMGHFHPTETIADKLSSLLQFQNQLLLHVSRPLRWDSDHVVLFNDDLRAVFSELVRGQRSLGSASPPFEKAIVALDYFDASINRITAYVIGIRATRKAMLSALLEPTHLVQEAERNGQLGRKLALLEEFKTLPFGDVWDELCARADVPLGRDWIQETESYEERVLARRSD